MKTNNGFEVEVANIKYAEGTNTATLPKKGIFAVDRRKYMVNPNATLAAAINLQTGVPVKNFRIVG
jgi:hypothetical protein